MLGQLPAWGVDAIAIVPYGRVGRVPPADARSWESDDGVRITAGEARRLGIRVMLKPHTGSKPQPADLATPKDRDAWFAGYTAFIVHYARLAAEIHADLLAVGTEFGWLTQHEAEWRKIIAEVRSAYPGPLVYAATHGPEFDEIRFWDALDFIGLDNYIPMPDDYSTGAMVARVEAVQRRFQKPVLFTEAGYSAVENAHRTPWEDETRKPLSLEEQARCYRALLEAFYGKPWFRGVYWWKVGTNGYGGPENNSMTPWRKPAMDVVRRFYLRANGG
jgi:hypothetical protein